MAESIIPKSLASDLTVQTGNNGSIYYRKYGRVCTVSVVTDASASIPANAWYTLGTLPEGCRPDVQTNAVFYDNKVSGSTLQYTAMTGRINTNGNVTVWPYRTDSQPMGTVTFITAS